MGPVALEQGSVRMLYAASESGKNEIIRALITTPLIATDIAVVV
jgi:hypothetical protein